MFRVDTFRLIRKTSNRFLSLVSIVFIGVAFMMGLFSTADIMKKSVDSYNDSQNLQDIQLYSSYGFEDEDIQVISCIDVVEWVYPSKFTDCYAIDAKGNEVVARARELNSNVNLYTLVEGRKPLTETEILILDETIGYEGFSIGSTITLSLKEDDLSEKLKNCEYTIVGKVSSSEFMNRFSDTSTLDNQQLATVLYIPNDNFIFDYYTTVYCTLKDASSLNSFSQQYKDLVETDIEEIELVCAVQQEVLKDKLVDEYRQKIEDGKVELEKGKAEGQQKLDDAKKQLNDANIKIIVGEMELDTARSTLALSTQQLNIQEELLNEQQQTVDNKITDVEAADGQGRDFAQIVADTAAQYNAYNTLNSLKNTDFESNANEQIDSLERVNEQQRTVIERNTQDRANYQTQLNEVNAQLSSDPYNEELTAQKNELQNNIDMCNENIASAQAIIDGNNITITNLRSVNNVTYNSAIEQAMNNIDANAGGSITDRYNELSVIAAEKSRVEASRTALQTSRTTITSSYDSLKDLEKQIADGKRQYEEGLKEYEDGVIEYNKEIEKAELELRKAQQQLDDLPNAQWMILSRQMHNTSYMYENTTKQMNAIGIVMPFLFYLVAALVCTTTMTRLIDEQRGQIGIYRALGFSKKQIIGKYATYAFLASIIGSIPAIFAGIALFPTVIYTTWRLMYTLPQMTVMIPLDKALICILAFAVLMVGVSCVVVNRSLSESAASLMRPKPPRNAKKVFLEYIPVLWQKLSFTSKITARNMIRYKARFFMTVIGVSGCTSLLVLGFGVKDSISDVVNVQYGRFYHYNYNITLENDDYLDDILTILSEDLNNEIINPYMSYNGSVWLDNNREETIIVEVSDAREFSDMYHLTDYRSNESLKMNNSEIIVTERFCQNNNLKVGDTITLSSKSGLKAQVTIGAISKMYFQHYLYISDVLYENLFEENVHYNNIAVLNETDADALIDSVKEQEDVIAVSDFSSFIEQFDIMIQALDLIILVIVITSGCLAFVVLINLSQVNISERLREIATLKVLGFRPLEVDGYIGKELILLTLLGAVAGLPLGKLELKFVMNVINMEMVMFPTDIKLLSYLYGYLITVIFTLIVLLIMKKPLRKIEMVESLKSVE